MNLISSSRRLTPYILTQQRMITRIINPRCAPILTVCGCNVIHNKKCCYYYSDVEMMRVKHHSTWCCCKGSSQNNKRTTYRGNPWWWSLDTTKMFLEYTKTQYLRYSEDFVMERHWLETIKLISYLKYSEEFFLFYCHIRIQLELL